MEAPESAPKGSFALRFLRGDPSGSAPPWSDAVPFAGLGAESAKEVDLTGAESELSPKPALPPGRPLPSSIAPSDPRAVNEADTIRSERLELHPKAPSDAR